MNPTISICIPAYKRVNYLERLLDSIAIQTYKNYEVVITDDSPDDSVSTAIGKYEQQFSLRYHKNAVSMGSPGNWLAAIKQSSGQWIKLMHDDDWFRHKDSLSEYAKATNEGAKFIFSGYSALYESTNEEKDMTVPAAVFSKMMQKPCLIFANNVIGPPSVSMVDRSIVETYDERLKWFVDMEYYYRILNKEPCLYIEQSLVFVSYNDTQITSYVRTSPETVIPEAMYIFSKHGSGVCKHPMAYDSWWRVFRNLDVASADNVLKYAPGAVIPPYIVRMLSHLAAIPEGLRKNKYVSKTMMLLSYLRNLPMMKALDKNSG